MGNRPSTASCGSDEEAQQHQSVLSRQTPLPPKGSVQKSLPMKMSKSNEDECLLCYLALQDEVADGVLPVPLSIVLSLFLAPPTAHWHFALDEQFRFFLQLRRGVDEDLITLRVPRAYANGVLQCSMHPAVVELNSNLLSFPSFSLKINNRLSPLSSVCTTGAENWVPMNLSSVKGEVELPPSVSPWIVQKIERNAVSISLCAGGFSIILYPESFAVVTGEGPDANELFRIITR